MWGAHGLIAASSLRSLLERGFTDLDAKTRQRIEQVVGAVDDRFRSYTEVNEFERLEKVDGRSDPGRGWWWSRIPKSGPARQAVPADEIRSTGHANSASRKCDPANSSMYLGFILHIAVAISRLQR